MTQQRTRVLHFDEKPEPDMAETTGDASKALLGLKNVAEQANLPMTVNADGSISVANHTLTKTGLIRGARASKADWKRLGPVLFALEASIQWQIGDYLDQGEREWGETVADMAAQTGRDAQTLYNWISVVRKFEISRRREKLYFGHHEAVAALPVERQDELLDEAAENGWSVARLRRALKPLPAALSAEDKFHKELGSWDKWLDYDAETRNYVAAQLERKAQMIRRGRIENRK